MPRDDRSALSFGSAVDDYERGRPGYPAEAVDWILGLTSERRPTGEHGGSGIRNEPLTAIDLGAGSGKFTASLVERGLDCRAVEPDPQMRARLQAKLPGVDARAGSAESIPFDDASADLVTVAQAWHWIDPVVASAEIGRVLRPSGALALIWNVRDDSVGWVDRFWSIFRTSAAENYDSVTPRIAAPLRATAYREFAWQDTLTVDELLALVTSRSYVIRLSPAERDELMGRVRSFLDDDPDVGGSTTFVLPYVTRVTVATPESNVG
ncbi:class I SAM-dependent methyltransferase [Compostimonas suwonensis]|uniref:Methyltransferase family protein n=1 Tax=Compostimonas suwonensis TaxID=1048394 RepID=A0A2M9BB50_9MICO|nr:class I SAM-dependent methyltransferase [Compostimonas suwonensis]PJJ55157.1 methyltransferase family protein [Compostimonas suwonensis]